MKCDQDLCLNLWYDLKKTLARWTQPSGPLCLWQCLLYYLTIENFPLGYLCPRRQWANSIDTCVKLGDHLNLFNCHHKYSNHHQLRLRSRFQIHWNLTWSKNINYVELQYCSNLSKCTICVACILITVKCQCYVLVHTQRERPRTMSRMRSSTMCSIQKTEDGENLIFCCFWLCILRWLLDAPPFSRIEDWKIAIILALFNWFS